MTNTAELKERIKSSGLKLGYIAEQLGISRQYLSKKVNNRAHFTVTEMYRLSDLLRLNEREQKDFFYSGCSQKGN